jgi:sigma-54 dependent transcriptional regulator, acetoin dehydrogenase operon transcriptional activator AcoR
MSFLRHPSPVLNQPLGRLAQIDAARQAAIYQGMPLSSGSVQPWISRSWARCLASGQRPEQTVGFDAVPSQALGRIEEANHSLLAAAQPTLARLGRAIADTRYFAILTDARGVVVDVHGPVDRQDARAQAIARLGVDLSEQRIGTSAISAALTELHPVWLHRGEHFFNQTSAYSCAGAPLFGPDGECVGMLDLTGIDAQERPELKHLVAQSARSIENSLTLARQYSLLVRVNWPGRALGDETDGLICLDADGWVAGANPTARNMVSQLGQVRHANHANDPATNPSTAPLRLHCSDLFAVPFEMLFDQAQADETPARNTRAAMEVPLWSGLHVNAVTVRRTPTLHPIRASIQRPTSAPATPGPLLRDTQAALIRTAVAQARGNIMQAAKALGISRSTVYRKITDKKKRLPR